MAGPIPPSWYVDPESAGARELAPGLFRLRLPWCWEQVDHSNAYLLTDGDEHVLVDCGPGGTEPNRVAFERAMAQTGVPVEAITKLVLTHAHSDHVGQLWDIVERSGAEVWCHPDTRHVDEIITEPERSAAKRGGRARAEGAPEEELPWFEDLREEVDMIGAPIPFQHELTEGTEVPTPFGPLTVMHTPGHAPSQVALVQPERGIAIVGDTICVAFGPYYDYGFSPDPVGEMLASLDRLDTLSDYELVLPGHGGPLADAAAVIDEHRTGITGHIDLVRRAVADSPGGAYAIGERAFGPVDEPFAVFLRTDLAASYLRHLRVNGEIERTEDADGRFTYTG